MLKITEDNYELYKKVLEILWRFMCGLTDGAMDPDGEFSPINGLISSEKKNKLFARIGLKEALRDTLTWVMMELSATQRKSLNNQLINSGLPSLNQLLAEIKDTPAKVLKKGKIKNIDEYYIIKEVLSDVENNLPQESRDSLEKILGEFEMHNQRK